MNRNAVICPPCGENVEVATKRGAYKAFSLMSPSIGPADHFLRKGGRKGFTLIELLVVVLIIGILAAVALPQYKLAVAKAKVTSFLPLFKAITQAQEIYYLEHGAYAANLQLLDLAIPETCTLNTVGGKLYGSGFSCGNDIFINNGVLGRDATGEMSLMYCPNSNTGFMVCHSGQQMKLWVKFAHYPDTGAGRRECIPIDTLGKRLCNALVY